MCGKIFKKKEDIFDKIQIDYEQHDAKARNLEELILEVPGMYKSYLHKSSMAKIIKATNFFENLMYSSIRYFYRFLS